MTLDPGSRVCPRCGSGAEQHQYCPTCGLHLTVLPEIPSRAEWDAGAKRVGQQSRYGDCEQWTPPSGPPVEGPGPEEQAYPGEVEPGPGWADDPYGDYPGQQSRYWDGEQWTPRIGPPVEVTGPEEQGQVGPRRRGAVGQGMRVGTVGCVGCATAVVLLVALIFVLVGSLGQAVLPH